MSTWQLVAAALFWAFWIVSMLAMPYWGYP